MAKTKKTLAEQLHSRRLHKPPKVIYCILGYLWKLMYFKKLGVKVEMKADPRKQKGAYIVVSEVYPNEWTKLIVSIVSH